ncbi:Protein lin-28 [Gossypium arboreum]|uniref:Protein lin-28 n=1 Tax=Gossypium arboreum TaxID=29729 RepID=A0A0B0PD28_GOSAR|nr:Protein lin-28 [Gossypium arboreum]
MELISYNKEKVPCKTMPRHGIGEFIRQGYHVRPCQDMATVSFKRIPGKTMKSHGNGKWFNGKIYREYQGKVS